ncbi:hemopexin repeat-containing protein [Paenibacillus sp. R14(2021)]|uniref:hemopexin repeat-containing protein n=1 Tax=Paenibacillus sp. R14(2021) TaxID=2859228 RepID=UPI001C612F41|nr:hemopexin repeat-containing protein [Paenibacillus sp. R14(2021)]
MSEIKSAIAWPNGKSYLFRNNDYIRFDFESGSQDQDAQSMAQWRGLRMEAPDAAVYWGFGKAHFFYGDEYVRYDVRNDGVDEWYLAPNPPRKIADQWPGVWPDRIDAAVNWGNGKLYFFRGSEYLRYDITLDRVDPEYPKPIGDWWPGVWPDNIDAVLYQGGQKAYFFKGSEYRRYDLDADCVDASGQIDDLVLDPVPSGMWTPARELTVEQANKAMGYLIQNGKLSLKATQTPYNGDWSTNIQSPRPTQRVAVSPATINHIDLINENNVGVAVIDNVDQRMLVCLYRLTRWVNASQPDISAIRHLGIGHGGQNPNDCHNQGRAMDFSGLEGTFMEVAFNRQIARDWGNKPEIPGKALRLDPAVDPLAHELFLKVFNFASFECENNGIGAANTWSGKAIGDIGGFVIHPDYVDDPHSVKKLRAAHFDHIHMQIGPTFI